MSEVEKMYENAGIRQICNTCELRGFKRLCPTKEQCVRINPPFTAEKQLKIMAFLINRKVGLSFKAEQGEITVEAISRGLAGIVNRIWQDLTEQEKTEIADILRG